MPLDDAERRWITDRFTEIDRRITYVNGLPVKVAELNGALRATKNELASVKHELTHEDGAVAKLTRKLEEITAGPAKRREGILMAAIGGFIGVGGGGLLVAILTGGVH